MSILILWWHPCAAVMLIMLTTEGNIAPSFHLNNTRACCWLLPTQDWERPVPGLVWDISDVEMKGLGLSDDRGLRSPRLLGRLCHFLPYHWCHCVQDGTPRVRPETCVLSGMRLMRAHNIHGLLVWDPAPSWHISGWHRGKRERKESRLEPLVFTWAWADVVLMCHIRAAERLIFLKPRLLRVAWIRGSASFLGGRTEGSGTESALYPRQSGWGREKKKTQDS